MTPPAETPSPSLTLHSRSASLQKLFEELGCQFYAVFLPPDLIGSALREKIMVEGDNLEQLLEGWINAQIGLLREQHMAFREFRVTALESPKKGPCMLQAEAVGELLDPHRHVLSQKTTSIRCQSVRLSGSAGEYSAEVILAQ